MRTFRMEMGETARFIEDCALLGVDDRDRETLCVLLSANPAAGVPRPDKPSFLEWEFQGLLVTYVLSADLGRLVLLEARPATSSPTPLHQFAWKWIERMSIIRQLLGF